jgi:hypothetical protein
VYIAQFEEYTFLLIDHLIEKKVGHWDIAIRELSAKVTKFSIYMYVCVCVCVCVCVRARACVCMLV